MLSTLKSVASAASAVLHPIEYAKGKLIEMMISACVPVLKKFLSEAAVKSLRNSANQSRELGMELKVPASFQSLVADASFRDTATEALTTAFNAVLNPLGLCSGTIALNLEGEILKIKLKIAISHVVTTKL